MEKKSSIHFNYITGILITIIICLVTIKWSKITNFTDYIMFASAITSIVLAILAIFYAVYANTAFEKNIGSLNYSSADITKSTYELKNVIDHLKMKMDDLPGMLKNLDDKISSTQNEIKNLSQPLKSEVKTENKEEFRTEIITSFFNSTSYASLLLFFLVKNSFLKKTPIKFKESLVKVNISNFDYCYGYLIAVSAIGFLQFTYNDDILNITYLSEKIIEPFEKKLSEYTNSEENHPMKKFLSEGIDSIEKLFT